MRHEIINGNCAEALKNLPDESVDCCITSPPYWGLRDYKTEPLIWDAAEGCEHEWQSSGVKKYDARRDHDGRDFGVTRGKEPTRAALDTELRLGDCCSRCGAWRGQLGLEPNPNLYIKHLVGIFDEVKRVLKKTGTCWVNLGDSYSANRSYQVENSISPKTENFTGQPKCKDYGMPEKCLVQIPSRFAIAMVDNGWILRNEIIWHKKNCMPSSVKDRFTVDFEKIFFFVKSKKYYFEPQHEPLREPERMGHKFGGNRADEYGPRQYSGKPYTPPAEGRNKRTVWTISTKPYSGAHFAVFPAELVEIPIKAGCPKFICSKCGQPRKVIYEKWWDNPVDKADRREVNNTNWQKEGAERMNKGKYPTGVHYDPKGLTDCGCGAPFIPGVVLDPFGGSGTTAMVARSLGRSSITIELNAEYIGLIKERVQSDLPALDDFSASK